ncbi:MAG: VIT domain-containing protein [Candidatus Eisenbacteria bacterium]
MKRMSIPAGGFVAAIVLLLGGLAGLAVVEGAGDVAACDKTLSPYFLVRSDDPDLDQLPLKSTSAEVSIAGVIADVRVTQTYRNEGATTLEAIYAFPASTRAAVYGMKMTIGLRTIAAEIRERERARQEYEEAREEGRTASLLEEQRPNVFQMSVANILPGDEIKVELSYTELLVPTEGVYEFVYPTVVGPRYSHTPRELAPERDKFVETPYLREGEPATYGFDITVYLSAGLPIRSVASTSHRVRTRYDRLNSAAVKLDPREKSGGNRDFVLRYQLAGDEIESGLLLYEGEKENFFLFMVEPPKHISPREILPREYIFIVDVSGSMMGFPLEVSKKLLRDIIVNLRPSDMFNVLLFSGGWDVMAENSVPAIGENIEKATHLIDNQRGGGGTELLPALERALSFPRAEGFSRSIVITTDGYVDVERQAFELIRGALENANVFVFGIGKSVNRYIIEGMARAGMGEPFVVANESQAGPQAERFRRYVQFPVLTQVGIDFGGFDVYDTEPLSIPDVMAERPVVVFGKWRGELRGQITLRGLAADRPRANICEVVETIPSHRNAALRYLWARHRIAALDDLAGAGKDDARSGEITKLGLTYNLLTFYTSFVAVDSQVRRNEDGELETVRQVLPLPSGVPNPAVCFAPFSRGGSSLQSGNVKLMVDFSSLMRRLEITVERIVCSDKKVSLPDLTNVIEDQLKGLVSCYRDEVPATQPLKGRVTLRITIDAEGFVTSAKIVSNNLGKAVSKCTKEEIMAWRFGKLHFNKSVSVLITFKVSE